MTKKKASTGPAPAEPAKNGATHSTGKQEPAKAHAEDQSSKHAPAHTVPSKQDLPNAPQHQHGKEEDVKQHVTQMAALNNEQPSSVNSENSIVVEQVRQLQQQLQDNQQEHETGPENQQVVHKEVHFVCPFDATAAFIAGTFNNWNFQPLSRGTNGKYEMALRLPSGTYFYKYVIDGDWKCDPDKPTQVDPDAYENNVLVVP
eukprot:TRINITY_DN1797_c0_g1_i1.p1 TRINITY_DN1797_c0_g1~~TRINITY_DN1797_c0_g1_i1.p1  ORF type:complete len:202 (-),score=58.15 TRINITY_DN1797_c0_g1_i1:179-784(-)